MFFAQNNTVDKFEIYISFLNEIINKNNERYKVIFHNIIKEAHDLAGKSINYSSLSKETFELVSLLVYNHSAYFKKLNVEDITERDYRKILSFLNEDIKQMA